MVEQEMETQEVLVVGVEILVVLGEQEKLHQYHHHKVIMEEMLVDLLLVVKVVVLEVLVLPVHHLRVVLVEMVVMVYQYLGFQHLMELQDQHQDNGLLEEVVVEAHHLVDQV
jgi:hypothetical protein